MNSTLNFGILPVLFFQLEVYYKVDRLLTGLAAQQNGTTSTRKVGGPRFLGTLPRNLGTLVRFLGRVPRNLTPPKIEEGQLPG